MKHVDRHPCRCQCDCDCSAAGEICWLCTEGTHAAPRAVRNELFARAEIGTRIVAEATPDSSSGISQKALQVANDRTEAVWRERDRRAAGAPR